MNLVVPMAGRGSRFANRGDDRPKPLIPVAGKPMVAWALQSVANLSFERIIFVALSEHETKFKVSRTLTDIAGPTVEIILLDDVTEGQLCTVLTARRFIDNESPLLICSSDTLVESNLADDIINRPSDSRGMISVANMPGSQWSFAKTDEHGRVVEVAEKVRISDNASTGLYFFSSGTEFVSAADSLLASGKKTKGEYYVIPVYQSYIEDGKRVDISVAHRMWDMGTPEALARFEQHLSGSESLVVGS